MPKLLTSSRFGKRTLVLGKHPDAQTKHELSDAELMVLIARGDQEAFDLVYVRYKTQLSRFIAKFVQDEACADDLLQEAFLRVYRSADKFKPEGRFVGWLYRIATNLCLNELRRRRAHPQVSLNREVQFAVTDSESESVELHELIPDTATSPGEAVEWSETQQQILSALDEISSSQREVLSMRLWDELKFEEIAGALQVSVGTAKSRAFYGLKALRDKLESLEEED